MLLSEKLSKELGVEVVFNGGQFEVYTPAGMFTLSMLQALSIIRQLTSYGIKEEV